MIDYEDFKGMCDRVARVTGRIDEETRKLYWESLRDHNRETLARAMKRVGREHGYYKFPTIAEIMDAIRDSSETRGQTKTWCEKCNMTGMIIAEKDGYSTAYRCDCANAKGISPAIRKFEDVAGLYGEDRPAEPEARPRIKLEAIEAIDDDFVYERGVVVEKTCNVCWKPFIFEHHRKILSSTLKDFHSQRPPICMDCYIEDGKKKGKWK